MPKATKHPTYIAASLKTCRTLRIIGKRLGQPFTLLHLQILVILYKHHRLTTRAVHDILKANGVQITYLIVQRDLRNLESLGLAGRQTTQRQIAHLYRITPDGKAFTLKTEADIRKHRWMHHSDLESRRIAAKARSKA